jgi:hypothetical protein
MKEKELGLIFTKEKKDSLDSKLYEEVCKLQVVGNFLQILQQEFETNEDTLIEKVWGAELIVDEVTKNLMNYREEYFPPTP